MENYTWDDIRNVLLEVLEKVEPSLDKDALESVMHYINHDEYEMAFEGLFLEIMKLRIKPNIDFGVAKDVGIALKLNEESVFDINFWNKFERYTLPQ